MDFGAYGKLATPDDVANVVAGRQGLLMGNNCN